MKKLLFLSLVILIGNQIQAMEQEPEVRELTPAEIRLQEWKQLSPEQWEALKKEQNARWGIPDITEYPPSILSDAVKVGNIDQIRNLLKIGIHADERAELNGKTPLMHAIEFAENCDIKKQMVSLLSSKANLWEKIIHYSTRITHPTPYRAAKINRMIKIREKELKKIEDALFDAGGTVEPINQYTSLISMPYLIANPAQESAPERNKNLHEQNVENIKKQFKDVERLAYEIADLQARKSQRKTIESHKTVFDLAREQGDPEIIKIIEDMGRARGYLKSEAAPQVIIPAASSSSSSFEKRNADALSDASMNQPRKKRVRFNLAPGQN